MHGAASSRAGEAFLEGHIEAFNAVPVKSCLVATGLLRNTSLSGSAAEVEVPGAVLKRSRR